MKCKAGLEKNIKATNCKKNVSIEPPRLFTTDGAGVGKSHLMKTICIFLIKTTILYSVLPHKPKVLILATTGVAAITINGKTINSGYTLPRLSFRFTHRKTTQFVF